MTIWHAGFPLFCMNITIFYFPIGNFHSFPPNPLLPCAPPVITRYACLFDKDISLIPWDPLGNWKAELQLAYCYLSHSVKNTIAIGVKKIARHQSLFGVILCLNCQTGILQKLIFLRFTFDFLIY